MTNSLYYFSSKVDYLITIAYHWLLLLLILYLPMQNVRDIDYKNFTKFRVQ